MFMHSRMELLQQRSNLNSLFSDNSDNKQQNLTFSKSSLQTIFFLGLEKVHIEYSVSISIRKFCACSRAVGCLFPFCVVYKFISFCVEDVIQTDGHAVNWPGSCICVELEVRA